MKFVKVGKNTCDGNAEARGVQPRQMKVRDCNLLFRIMHVAEHTRDTSLKQHEQAMQTKMYQAIWSTSRHEYVQETQSIKYTGDVFWL